MSKGYIYVASNDVGGVKENDYIQEAIFSATSLKNIDPQAKITLFTDKKIKNTIFDEVKIVDMSLRCKQRFLLDSPYDKTIYLDTDTYINHNIEDLFELLDNFDLAACHCYSRKRNFTEIPEYMNIPYCFSEINSGVLAYKKTENFNKFSNLWNHYYQKYKKVVKWDQPSLRIALWESKINFYILPIEFNRRSQGTKEKVFNMIKTKHPYFDENTLKTRVYHFHGIEKMKGIRGEIERNAQHL